MKTVAFFNNKGGVGKTTLVYHLGHIMAESGGSVLMVDLDPQSNLTSMCLGEDALERLWPAQGSHPHTLHGALEPMLRGIGDVGTPHVIDVGPNLSLLAGDLALGTSSLEDRLSNAWPRALDRDESAFRLLSALHRLIRAGGAQAGAALVLIDVGPNLGALNRAAMLAAEHIVTPLAPDLFSMQALRNLGPTLTEWREGWADRRSRAPAQGPALPAGAMAPAGYVVMQSGMRLNRPVKAYQRWVAKLPGEYHRAMLGASGAPATTDTDAHCLGVLRHYQSLMPLAQDARKPMFALKPADGAIGAHAGAVERCRADFTGLANQLLAAL